MNLLYLCDLFYMFQDSVSNNSTDENGGDVGNSANSRATPTSQGPQHPAVSALRPTPSPVGSAGSRSNTPASVTGMVFDQGSLFTSYFVHFYRLSLVKRHTYGVTK